MKPIYAKLADRFGMENVYILSAGWGLVRSDFLLPQYDITFKSNADSYKRRKANDRYHDFCFLSQTEHDDVIFFGGKDYLPFFCALADKMQATRIVFYNSKTPPQVSGCRLVRYETAARTNWHYACASDLIAHPSVARA